MISKIVESLQVQDSENETSYFTFATDDQSTSFTNRRNNIGLLNQVSLDSDPNSLQFYSRATEMEYLRLDQNSMQPNGDPQLQYTVNLGRFDAQIEDQMFLNQSQYGIMKFNNNSFCLFIYDSNPDTLAEQRISMRPATLKNFGTLKFYQFDKVNGLAYIGDSVSTIQIWDVTPSYNASGQVILMSWKPVRNMTLTQFDRFDLQNQTGLLLTACPTCDSSAGRITLYNITNTSLVTPPTVFTFAGTIALVNGTMRALIGERAYLQLISPSFFRIVYTSKNTTGIALTTQFNYHEQFNYTNVTQQQLFDSNYTLYSNAWISNQTDLGVAPENITIPANITRQHAQPITIVREINNFAQVPVAAFRNVSFSNNLIVYMTRDSNPAFNITNETTDIVPSTLTSTHFINVCPYTHYYNGIKCLPCKQYFGTTTFQSSQCDSCATMVQQTDISFTQSLAYRLCDDPLNFIIPNDNNGGNGGNNNNTNNNGTVIDKIINAVKNNPGLAIGLGIGIPVIVIILIIVCAIVIKKKKQESDSKSPNKATGKDKKDEEKIVDNGAGSGPQDKKPERLSNNMNKKTSEQTLAPVVSDDKKFKKAREDDDFDHLQDLTGQNISQRGHYEIGDNNPTAVKSNNDLESGPTYKSKNPNQQRNSPLGNQNRNQDFEGLDVVDEPSNRSSEHSLSEQDDRAKPKKYSNPANKINKGGPHFQENYEVGDDDSFSEEQRITHTKKQPVKQPSKFDEQRPDGDDDQHFEQNDSF